MRSTHLGAGSEYAGQGPQAGALGLSEMFWVNVQAHYDAEIAREHIATKLATIECIA